LRVIAVAVQAIPNIPTFSVAWSVVTERSHSCTLLKPFDGFRCRLAVWGPSIDTA